MPALLAAPASAASSTLKLGSTGPSVEVLQKALDRNGQADFFGYPTAGVYTQNFGSVTRQGLQRWQRTTHHQATGSIQVGSSEWKQLMHEALGLNLPAGIDSRAIRAAKHSGVAIDASKHTRLVHVIKRSRSGALVVSLTAAWRFGDGVGKNHVLTRDGVWHIYRKGGRHYKSNIFEVDMPWAAFFSGGEAFHYSADFARVGYAHGSGGCANLRSMAAAKYIHGLPIGTTVVIHF